jgi:2-polyprenyl-3-methyl-5-hydroxy-6-metoxy-1,4-benzoquinol methylase
MIRAVCGNSKFGRVGDGTDCSLLLTDIRAPSSTFAGPELVCPNDGQRLVRGRGDFQCSSGHIWLIHHGIPRMAPDRSYADAFGLQWKTYRRTQLDSHTGTTLSRDRARRCLGDECWRLLTGPERCDVLEVGCGAGRFTEILLSTVASVTSVDLSAAVEANQENFPQDGRHRVLQADVLRLPFESGQFDVVFCLGVIQHTPRPEKTIRKLYEQVRPGGWLVLDHYTWSLSEVTKSAMLFRLLLRHVRSETGLRWSARLVDTFLPLHKAARRNRIAQRILSRVSPVLAYYHHLPLTDDLHREWALLDTHDALTDRYKHFRTKRQIEQMLRTLGATEIWCEYGGNGVEARCRRPAE